MHRLLPMRSPRLAPVRSQPDRPPGTKHRPYFRLIAALTLIILLVQPACLFRKKKAALPEAVHPVPARVVLLPLNIPAENSELRWVAMAAPILMAKTMEGAPDLEIVPIWQSTPIAAEAVGASREITPETAAYVASRLAAKWAVEGQLSPSKDGHSLLLDFIPAKATTIAYRYQSDVRVETLGAHSYESVTQFLRYLVARPMGKSSSPSTDVTALKQLGETLDREYGWFTAADAGKAEGVVTSLVRTDPKMARLLFNPGLYPAVGPVPSKPRPLELTPAPLPPAEKPAAKPGASPEVQAPAPSPRAEANELEVQLVVPPPKRFVQKMASQPSARGEEGRVESAQAPPPTPSPPTVKRRQIAAAATPASLPPPPPQSKSSLGPTKGFKVQVLAVRKKQDAETTARKLEREGFHTEIEEKDLKEKGILNRVRIVGYKSHRAAKEAAEKLLSASLIQQYWIIPAN